MIINNCSEYQEFVLQIVLQKNICTMSSCISIIYALLGGVLSIFMA
jgi:hypothetical protein